MQRYLANFRAFYRLRKIDLYEALIVLRMVNCICVKNGRFYRQLHTLGCHENIHKEALFLEKLSFLSDRKSQYMVAVFQFKFLAY